MRFVDVTAASGIVEAGYGMGVAVRRLRRRRLRRSLRHQLGPNELWRNRGDGAFERRGAAAGVDDPGWSVPAVFFDADRDGWLDLYVGNYVDFSAATHKRCLSALGVLDYCGPLTFEAQPDVLYRNRGDGTFEDVSGPAGLRAAPPMPALGALSLDVDDDGWLDLYVANDQTPNYLWRGSGDGRFTEEALASGCAVDADGKPQASMGVTAGDYDGDGDEDLFLTHITEEHHTLYVDGGGGVVRGRHHHRGAGGSDLRRPHPSFDRGGGVFEDSAPRGTGRAHLGPHRVRHRLDRLRRRRVARPAGDEWSGEDHSRSGDGGRSAAAAPAGPAPAQPERRPLRRRALAAGDPLARAVVGRGLAFGDVDNDGDADVVITENNGPARLLLNQVGNRRPWIGLRLVERAGSGRDRDVLDAWVAASRRRTAGAAPAGAHRGQLRERERSAAPLRPRRRRRRVRSKASTCAGRTERGVVGRARGGALPHAAQRRGPWRALNRIPIA